MIQKKYIIVGIFLLLAYGIVYVVVDLSCEFNNNYMKICQEVINK